jgi:hypothetical protein
MILTDNILLIEPVGFGFNHETAFDNKFQNEGNADVVQLQFDNFRTELENAGLKVSVLHPPDNRTPDALYPNNWFSTFPDSRLIIYPMMAINRRAEKRLEFIDHLKQKYSKITDLSYLENSGSFLEGTGSLVLDHTLKIAYACTSPRTSVTALEKWKQETGYDVILFAANDENGFPIYHTNVILTLAGNFAIVCSDAIINSDKSRIENHLNSTGREIISISFDQTKKFCGNCLALRNSSNEQLIIMSDQAKTAFADGQISQIEKYSKIISTNLSEIESIGGGGARCMIAELF